MGTELGLRDIETFGVILCVSVEAVDNLFSLMMPKVRRDEEKQNICREERRDEG